MNWLSQVFALSKNKDVVIFEDSSPGQPQAFYGVLAGFRVCVYFANVGFDIEHRRSIEGVNPFDMKNAAIPFFQPDDG